jgi:hypothetical protein
VRAEPRSGIATLEHRITLRGISALVVAVGIILVALRYLGHGEGTQETVSGSMERREPVLGPPVCDGPPLLRAYVLGLGARVVPADPGPSTKLLDPVTHPLIEGLAKKA